MRRRKRSLKLLFIALFSLVGLMYLLFFTTPLGGFSVSLVTLSTLFLFLLFLFIFLTSLTTYITFDVKKGLLIGGGIVGYLILRFLHLAQPFFIIILLALLASLMFVFSSKRT